MNQFMDTPNESGEDDNTIIHPLEPADIRSVKKNFVRSSHSRPRANESENVNVSPELNWKLSFLTLTITQA